MHNFGPHSPFAFAKRSEPVSPADDYLKNSKVNLKVSPSPLSPQVIGSRHDDGHFDTTRSVYTSTYWVHVHAVASISSGSLFMYSPSD